MKMTRNDINGILETVELYEIGHALRDIGMLENAFHSQASVVGYGRNGLMFAVRNEYLDGMKGKPGLDPNAPRPELKIRSFNIIGETANVTVESVIGGAQYVSHLSMIRIDGSWKIVNGLFHENRLDC